MIKWQGNVSPALQIAAGQALLPTKRGLTRSRAATHALFVVVKDTSQQFSIVSSKVVPKKFIEQFHPQNPLLDGIVGEEERRELSERAGSPVIEVMVTCVLCWIGERGQYVSNLVPSVLTVEHLVQFVEAEFDPNWEEALKTSNDYRWLLAPDGERTYVVRRDELEKEKDDKQMTYY